MTTEEMDLILKRKEMTKESWIRNVMRIHPEKSQEETEDLYNKIFESDKLTDQPIIGSSGLICSPSDNLYRVNV
jgi:hypothetical protein